MKDLLTKRQEEILKNIIDEYVLTAQPVGSQVLIEKYFKNLSSATIRNEMSILEKKGLISKHYSSSGRVPTINGYQYYEENIPQDISIKFKNTLREILSKRNASIDEVISKSVEAINEITHLPTVLTKIYENDLLKKIEMVPISDNTSLFIMVTSSGQIIKEEINYNKIDNVEDIVICVNVFNDRLVDTPMKDITAKLDVIKNIIKEKVKSYEVVLEEFVEKIFKNINWAQTNIKNSKEIIVHPEFTNVDRFQKILTLLNDVTIWKQIALNHFHTGKTSIIFSDDIGIDDTSIASTNIQLDNISHEISILGPNRLTYAKACSLLKFLKEEIERYYKNGH